MSSPSIKEKFFNGSFWAMWGLVAFFYNLPLTKMVLGDTQSLFLGNWDWAAFFLFILIAFILIPFLFSIGFSLIQQRSPSMARILMSAVAAYMIAAQANYFILEYKFEGSMLNTLFTIMLFSFSFLAIYKFFSAFSEFMKIFAVFSIGILLLFSLKTAPVNASTPAPQKTQPTSSSIGNDVPVFFFTFEKIALDYFTDLDNKILKKKFPNLASFVNDSDYYPNAYANSNATIFSLQTLYTGKMQGQIWSSKNPESGPHLRSIFDRNGKVFMIMDVLDYCNPAVDTCIRSIDTTSISRFSVISGWNKTYLRTILPEFIEKHLNLHGWEFNPWEDIWAEATSVKSETETPFEKIGGTQFKNLIRVLEQEGNAANLYIMHNWITDAPSIKSSIYTERTSDIYAKEKKVNHARLKSFDIELGKLIEHLKQNNIYNQSLIVLTSDTGYDPGIYGFKGDESLPASSELLKILLVIKRPGQTKGNRIKGVIRQIDILPTIMKILNMFPEAFEFDGTHVASPIDQGTLKDRPLNFRIFGKWGNIQYRLSDDGKTLTKQN